MQARTRTRVRRGSCTQTRPLARTHACILAHGHALTRLRTHTHSLSTHTLTHTRTRLRTHKQTSTRSLFPKPKKQAHMCTRVPTHKHNPLKKKTNQKTEGNKDNTPTGVQQEATSQVATCIIITKKTKSTEACTCAKRAGRGSLRSVQSAAKPRGSSTSSPTISPSLSFVHR